MTTEISDKELAARAVAQLDKGLLAIDDTTAVRLQRSRLNAVELLEKRNNRFELLRSRLSPALLSSLAIAVLAVSVWFAMPRSEMKTIPVDDLEIVTSPEHPDLLQDLEFFHWLSEKDASRMQRVE